MSSISICRKKNVPALAFILLAVLAIAILTGCSSKKEETEDNEDPNKKPTFEVGGIEVDLFQDFLSVCEKMRENGGAIYFEQTYSIIDSSGNHTKLDDYDGDLSKILYVDGKPLIDYFSNTTGYIDHLKNDLNSFICYQYNFLFRTDDEKNSRIKATLKINGKSASKISEENIASKCMVISELDKGPEVRTYMEMFIGERKVVPDAESLAKEFRYDPDLIREWTAASGHIMEFRRPARWLWFYEPERYENPSEDMKNWFFFMETTKTVTEIADSLVVIYYRFSDTGLDEIIVAVGRKL